MSHESINKIADTLKFFHKSLRALKFASTDLQYRRHVNKNNCVMDK